MFQAWSFLVYRSRVLHKTIQSYHKRRKKHSYNQWTQYNKYIINRQNVQLQYKTNKEIIHNENLTQIKIKKITFQHKQRNAVLIVVNHFKQGNKKKLYQAVSKWKSVTRNDALRDKKKYIFCFVCKIDFYFKVLISGILIFNKRKETDDSFIKQEWD